uniref:Uncharacterized protein n=1 Tax=Cacopsylla melanoneura TaxID=428564 RepID=A0A8D9BFU8_9HEMI
MSAVCVGCEAAAGGCKHILAFLYWLYRRSMEPASTSTTCYWAKPTLSKIGSTIKYIKLENLTEKVADPPSSIDHDNCLADFINQAKSEKTVCQISPYLSDASASPASLHLQMFNFKQQKNEEDAEKFILFLQSQIKSEDCHLLLKETVGQSRNKKWHELLLKYLKLYTVKTVDGQPCRNYSGCQKIEGQQVSSKGERARGFSASGSWEKN